MVGLEEYFANIINNTAYVPWETVNQKVIGPSIQAITKRLDEYPNFELISPMHYNENNVLKLTIEGAFVRGSTNCETFERMQKHSKLILRTLFRWVYNKRFADIISRRFMLSDLGVESYRVQSVSSIIRFTKDYTQCLKNDFFRILHKLSLPRQLMIVDEIRKILSHESTDSDLRSLNYLSYGEVHLDKMAMNFKEILKPLEFAEFVENVVFTKLFTINRSLEHRDIEERKGLHPRHQRAADRNRLRHLHPLPQVLQEVQPLQVSLQPPQTGQRLQARPRRRPQSRRTRSTPSTATRRTARSSSSTKTR